MDDRVIIEAAVNGGRSRREHPAIPVTPEEVAAEAERCAAAGACIVHIHAQDAEGNWRADAAWYAEAHRRIRERAPHLLISITTIRPAHAPVSAALALLATLAGDPATKPDLASINLGHIVLWERGAGATRRTTHFPNGYEDIAALLIRCRETGIVPELGIMDIGFLSNAVLLRDDGLLPAHPWFLVELDSPAFGAGKQVAPATVANYDFLASALRAHFPVAVWAAHGVAQGGYAVLHRALETGAHIRVGFEDAVRLPDDRQAESNAHLVAWAVAAARACERTPATPAEAAAIIGL